MKKHIAVSLAAILCTGGAMAQEGGAFVGVSFGRNQSSAKVDNSTDATTTTSGWANQSTPVFDKDGNFLRWDTETIATAESVRSFLQSGDSHDTKGDMGYGILAGYRWFLGETFALRGLAEFDYSRGKLKGNVPGSNKLNMMSFLVGADALAYFNRSESAQFGVFAGVGVAYHRYDLKLDFLDKSDFDSFGFMANLGLHADVAEHHGIELGARFFTNEAKGNSTIINQNLEGTTSNVSLSKYDVAIKQKPTFFVRYIYQF